MRRLELRPVPHAGTGLFLTRGAHLLRVIEVAEPLPERVEFDGYIPLNIRWAPVNPCVYWRGGSARAVHELGINPETARIENFTLVTARGAFRPGEWIDLRHLPARSGQPVVNLADWPRGSWVNGLKHHVDEPVALIVRLSLDAASVAFYPLDGAMETVCTGRTHFILGAAGELLGIEVRGLTSQEVATMRATLDREAGPEVRVAPRARVRSPERW